MKDNLQFIWHLMLLGTLPKLSRRLIYKIERQSSIYLALNVVGNIIKTLSPLLMFSKHLHNEGSMQFMWNINFTHDKCHTSCVYFCILFTTSPRLQTSKPLWCISGHVSTSMGLHLVYCRSAFLKVFQYIYRMYEHYFIWCCHLMQ